jgi:four helix bundle protein
METFEALRVWHDARSLTLRIYEATNDQRFRSDRSLAMQLRRAAISVMSNIAEGKERCGNKEFRHFLFIAKASCGEVRSQLYAAEDLGYLNQHEGAGLRAQAASLSRKLHALATALRKSPATL